MAGIKFHISMIKRGMATLMKIGKSFVILGIIVQILSQFSPYINLYMAARIIDGLESGQSINVLMLYVIITIGTNAIFSLIISGLNHLKNYNQNQIFKNENMYFSEKIMSMDYADIENRDIYLLHERIKTERNTAYNIYNLYFSLISFIGEAINIALAFTLTFSLFLNKTVSLSSKIIILVMVAVIIAVNYFTTKKREKLYLDLFDKCVPLNVGFEFFWNYWDDYNTGKDVRLYSMEEFVSKEQEKQKNMIDDLFTATIKKSLTHDTITSLSANILKIMTYIFVIFACMSGSVSIGSIAMYVGCIIRVVSAVNEIVRNIQAILTNNRYLENYFKFFDIPSKMYQGTLPVEKRDENGYTVEFKNVSFKYPGSENYALKNFNFKFNNSQRMAVVGMNGSGKTTMIKLFCRLYDPTEGEIYLNGIDIKKYKYNEYLDLFSVVFQDFKLFSFNLGQNVAASVDYDNEKVIKTLSKSGFDSRLENMPNGIETYLYKDFAEDGVEISGGEAQKIALARALYKDAPFIVLDEPTAALDPIAEYEIYSKFNEIVGDKTAIYISHRLSSCRFCDDIAVFHEGELTQRGSHDTLITDENGKYYELWNAQAQYYNATSEAVEL